MIEYSTRPSERHTLVALMQNHVGVLNRVSSMFRHKGFNIDSLTVCTTETPEISRMTIVVDGTTTDTDQVIKQLNKLIEVIEVIEITNEPQVSRELALIKVSTANNTRYEVLQLVNVYHGEIVDVSDDSVTAEVTGPVEKIDSMVGVMKPFGIKEMVRTGVVAMVRGAVAQA